MAASEAKRIAAAKEMEVEAVKAQRYISSKSLRFTSSGLGMMTPSAQLRSLEKQMSDLKSRAGLSADDPLSKMSKATFTQYSLIEKQANALRSKITENQDVIAAYNALINGNWSDPILS